MTTSSPTAFPKKMCTSDVTRTIRDKDKKKPPTRAQKPARDHRFAPKQNRLAPFSHPRERFPAASRHPPRKKKERERETTNLLTHQCRSRQSDFARSAVSRRIRPRDRARDPRKRAATRGLVAHTCSLLRVIRFVASRAKRLSLSLSGGREFSTRRRMKL